MEKLLTLLDRDNLVVAAVTVICVCAMYVFGPDGSKEIRLTPVWRALRDGAWAAAQNSNLSPPSPCSGPAVASAAGLVLLLVMCSPASSRVLNSRAYRHVQGLQRPVP
jgi:hypothetical protein